MTEERSNLACFYVGFNGHFRGVCRVVSVTVECSGKQPTGFTQELAGNPSKRKFANDKRAAIDHRHG